MAQYDLNCWQVVANFVFFIPFTLLCCSVEQLLAHPHKYIAYDLKRLVINLLSRHQPTFKSIYWKVLWSECEFEWRPLFLFTFTYFENSPKKHLNGRKDSREILKEMRNRRTKVLSTILLFHFNLDTLSVVAKTLDLNYFHFVVGTHSNRSI